MRRLLILSCLGLGCGLALLGFWKKTSCLSDFDSPRIYRSTISEYSASMVELQGDLILQRKGFFELEGSFKPTLFKQGDLASREFRSTPRRFQVQMDSQCLVSALEFDAGESFSLRDHIMKLMTFLDLSRRGSLSNSRFEARDFMGFSAFESGDASPGFFEWRRVRSLENPSPMAGDRNLTQIESILTSRIRFTDPGSSIWSEKVNADESFLVRMGANAKSQNLRYVLHMQRILDQQSSWMEQSIPLASTVVKARGERSRAYERPSLYDESASPAESLDLDTTLSRFMDLLLTDAVKAKRMLIAFLKANPHELSRLKTKIADEQFSDNDLVHILFSVAKTGSDSAQNVLAELISDPSLSLSTRLRVLFAVPEVPSANHQLVSAVQAETSPLKNPAQSLNDLNSTALLMTGVLARHAIDVDPRMEQDLKTEILEILKLNPDPAVKANVLDALGNYGNAELSTIVFEHVQAQDEAERTAAIKALVNLPHPAREAILIARLGVEDQVNVRAALAKTLAETGIQDRASLTVVAQKLLLDQEVAHRTLAVKVFGQAASRMPEARDTILNHIRTETDPQVLETAGRYLTAYELHAMRKRDH